MPGAFGTKQTTNTNQQQQQQQQSNLDPQQTKLNKNIFQQILSIIKQGPTVSQGDKDAARTSINRTYNAGDKALEANLAARGFNQSGKLAQGYRSNEIARNNAFSSEDVALQDQAEKKFQTYLGDAFAFDQPRSFSSSGTSSGTSTSSTQPGIGSILADLGGTILGGFSGLSGLFGGGPSGGGAAPAMAAPVTGMPSYAPNFSSFDAPNPYGG